VHFTGPEIELLFSYFDTDKNGRISIEEWNKKIFEDSQNPLAMLREVITEHQLSSEEILHKMRLRIWDEPLDLR